MNQSLLLLKEKIVTLSELQRNPSRALDCAIARIVRGGKEVGIFLRKDQFEDFFEETLDIRPSFKQELKKTLGKSKKCKRFSLKDL